MTTDSAMTKSLDNIAKAFKANPDRLSLDGLRSLVTAEDFTDRSNAAREYVNRLVDLELERRLDLRHNNPGFSSVSPTATMGMPVHHEAFKSDKPLKGRVTSSFYHERARRLLCGLPVRQYVAVLIQGAIIDQRTEGPWSITYDQLLANLGFYLRALGFDPSIEGKAKFGSVKQLRRAAQEGRIALMLAVQVIG